MNNPLNIKKKFNEEKEILFSGSVIKTEGFKFCEDYTKTVEKYLFQIFNGFNVNFAIVAGGSFCRRELAPYSDIDILFICENENIDGNIISSIVTSCWDAGIEISHTVRFFSDIHTFLNNDLHAFTQFLETRFLYGSNSVYNNWINELTSSVIDKDLLIEKFIEDYSFRHFKYGNSPKIVEPNIKFTAGGLRDFHLVEWIYSLLNNLSITYITESSHTLHFINLLISNKTINDMAGERLRESYDFILRVRNIMHAESKRKNDRLEFFIQEKIAKHFDSTDEGWQIFMKKYFYYSNILYRFSKTMIKGFKEQIENTVSDLLLIELDEDFYIKGVVISVKDEAVLDLSKTLKAFYYRGLHSARFNENLRSRIIESVINSDDFLARDGKSAIIFREILNLPKNVGKTLSTMNEIGVLGAFIPEFADLVGFFQPGVYHCFTADEHTLVALNNLEKLETDKGRLGKIYRSLKRRDLIFLAVLFHDIGKPIDVTGHEIVGAEIAGTVMNRFGFENNETEIVQFLVRNHLTMEQVAFRRNLNDPETLNNFAELFPTLVSLDLLYLLTFADLSAVNPAVWTQWKADLLHELYSKTYNMLENRLSAFEVLNEESKKMFDTSLFPNDDIVYSHIDSVNDPEYLQHYSEEEISKHAEEIDNGSNLSVFFKENSGFTNISILTKDSESLLSKLCGALSINDLNIHGAKIFTRSDGMVIDSFNVTDFISGEVVSKEKFNSIQNTITDAINGELNFETEINKARNRWKRIENRIFKRRGKVKVEFEKHDKYTIIDVYSPDRLGLLYQITKKLTQLNLSVYLAKISTQGDMVVDAFYVLNSDGKKADEGDYELIKTELFNSIQEFL